MTGHRGAERRRPTDRCKDSRCPAVSGSLQHRPGAGTPPWSGTCAGKVEVPAAQGRPRPQPRRAAGQFPGRRPPPRSLGAPQSIFSGSGPTFLSYPQLGHGVFPVPPQRALSMSNLPHTSDPCPSLLPIQPFPAPLWELLSSCRNLTPAPPGCGLGPPVDPGGLPLNWKRVLSRG